MRELVARILALAALAVLPSLAMAQEREWNFDTGEEDAYLIFGVPASDDVGVSFWCTIGSGEIKIFLPEAGDSLSPGQAVMIDVDVGGGQFSVTGETAVNEEAGTTSAEARLDSANPLFAAFLTADRFRVKIGKEESIFPLLGADFESLIRVCSPQR